MKPLTNSRCLMRPMWLWLLPTALALRQEQSKSLCCVAKGTNFDQATLLKVAQFFASNPKWTPEEAAKNAEDLLKDGFYMDPQPLERLTGPELDDVGRTGSRMEVTEDSKTCSAFFGGLVG